MSTLNSIHINRIFRIVTLLVVKVGLISTKISEKCQLTYLAAPPQILESTDQSPETAALVANFESDSPNFELSLFFRFKMAPVQGNYLHLGHIQLRTLDRPNFTLFKMRVDLNGSQLEISVPGTNRTDSVKSFGMRLLQPGTWYYLALALNPAARVGRILIAEDPFQGVVTDKKCNFSRVGSQFRDSSNGRASS